MSKFCRLVGRISKFDKKASRYAHFVGFDTLRTYANYPNPFNPDTWIPYYLPQDAEVTIQIHNSAGQLVRTLDIGRQAAGIYLDKDKAAYWDGRDSLGEKVASGIYYYTLRAGEFKATRKMVIVK